MNLRKKARATNIINNRDTLDDKLYNQISRLRSLNDELNRGVRRNEDQYLGLVDEIFGYFEEIHENCNLDLQSFKLENKDLERITAFFRKTDTVKGFDLTDDIQVDLELD